MKKWIAALMASFTLAGCATIAGENTQTIPLTTTPDGVSYKVTDERGVVVSEGVTPSAITLSKHDGSYFGKKSYTVTFEKEGYSPVSTRLQANANGKYVLGNLFFGNFLGWLIIDPLNGGMYDLSPEKISVDMNK